MITDDQHELIMQGFAKGVSDLMISKAIPGASHMNIFMFRKSLSITAQTIVDNRYDTWIRMLNSGVSLTAIAELYQVKPASIRGGLWRARNFSFVEAKKTARKIQDARYLGAVKKGNKGAFDW